MNKELLKAQDVFLERINQLCNKFGLNNIMAQLYAVLYLSNKPMSLDDMVERLKISKGSVSVNIRALERYNAVRQVWVKGSRRDYYEAEGEIVKVIIERIRSMASSRLIETEAMFTSSVKVLESVKVMNKEDEEAIAAFRAKIEKLRRLYDQVRSIVALLNTDIISKMLVSSAPDKKDGSYHVDSARTSM